MAAPLVACRKRLASRRHRMSHTAAATVQTHPPKSQTPPPRLAKLPQSATAPTVNTNANQRVVTVETPRPLAMEGHYPRRASSRHRARTRAAVTRRVPGNACTPTPRGLYLSPGRGPHDEGTTTGSTDSTTRHGALSPRTRRRRHAVTPQAPLETRRRNRRPRRLSRGPVAHLPLDTSAIQRPPADVRRDPADAPCRVSSVASGCPQPSHPRPATVPVPSAAGGKPAARKLGRSVGEQWPRVLCRRASGPRWAAARTGCVTRRIRPALLRRRR